MSGRILPGLAHAVQSSSCSWPSQDTAQRGKWSEKPAAGCLFVRHPRQPREWRRERRKCAVVLEGPQGKSPKDLQSLFQSWRRRLHLSTVQQHAIVWVIRELRVRSVGVLCHYEAFFKSHARFPFRRIGESSHEKWILQLYGNNLDEARSIRVIGNYDFNARFTPDAADDVLRIPSFLTARVSCLRCLLLLTTILWFLRVKDVGQPPFSLHDLIFEICHQIFVRPHLYVGIHGPITGFFMTHFKFVIFLTPTSQYHLTPAISLVIFALISPRDGASLNAVKAIRDSSWVTL